MISVLQEVSNEDFSGTGFATFSVTLTASAGSALVVFTAVLSGNPYTVTDSKSQSYTSLDTTFTDTNYNLSTFIASNVGAGSTTVTVNMTGTGSFLGIWVVEVGGAMASPLDGHNASRQAAPGSATDVITVSATNANQPALVLGFSMVSAGFTDAPATGTGFTSTKVAFSNAARSEYNRVTSATSQALTFSHAPSDSVGNGTYGTLVVILDEFVAPGPTITTQPKPVTTAVGTTATFTVSATGAGTLHYQWTVNGSNVGTDSSSYTTGTLTMASNGSVVQCAVTDNNGTTLSVTVYLMVYPVPGAPWLRA